MFCTHQRPLAFRYVLKLVVRTGLLFIAAGICFDFILGNALLASQSEELTSSQFLVVDTR